MFFGGVYVIQMYLLIVHSTASSILNKLFGLLSKTRKMYDRLLVISHVFRKGKYAMIKSYLKLTTLCTGYNLNIDIALRTFILP